MPRIAPPAVMLMVALASPAVATMSTIPVTTCGQAIPPRTIGILSADLDCTGFTGGPFGAAVTAGKKAVLDLGGFTLTGGDTGVMCIEPCARGGGLCPVRCTVRNGTIQDPVNIGVSGGESTHLDHVTIRGAGDRGVDAGRQVTITDSSITGNGVAGVLAENIKVSGSTITGNGRIGVATSVTGRASVKNSTVTGNDTDAACAPPTTVRCFDIGSARRPDVRYTTCGRSNRTGDTTFGGCAGWCVCSDDGP